MNIDVSIIIPIYNVSDYVEACLTSVMNQTYQGELECFLVDDCSPDNSMQKCKTLIDNYEGPITFHIISHEKNKGLSAARNTGTALSRGTYVYYLDSDDEITPNCIELLMQKVTQIPDVEMVLGFTKSIPDKAHYHFESFRDTPYIDSNKIIRKLFYPYHKIPMNACNKLISKAFLTNNNIVFMDRLIHEDELWSYFVMQHLSSIAFVFEPTYIRYYRKGSIMTTLTKEIESDSWYRILTEISKNIDLPFFIDKVKYIKRKYKDRKVGENHKERQFVILFYVLKSTIKTFILTPLRINR